MIHINNTTLNPSVKWIAKAQALTAKLAAAATPEERAIIIDANHRIWKMLKAALKHLSYNKCWYSEAREIYSHYHVDHFRPKKKAIDIDDIDRGGYWWLTFDWTNYRLMGSVGNSKKGDYFPVRSHKANLPTDPVGDEIFYFLDPVNRDDVKHLNFNEDGRAIPSADENKAPWSFQRADETITWFDLNYEDLKEERKRLWKRIATKIFETQALIDEFEQAPSNEIEGQITSKFEYFREHIAPCTELSGTVRCCLRSSGHDWATRLIEEEIDPDVYCKEYVAT